MWSKIRKVLGFLTDILTSGRKAGLWSEGQKVDPKGSPHNPVFPDVKTK